MSAHSPGISRGGAGGRGEPGAREPNASPSSAARHKGRGHRVRQVGWSGQAGRRAPPASSGTRTQFEGHARSCPPACSPSGDWSAQHDNQAVRRTTPRPRAPTRPSPRPRAGAQPTNRASSPSAPQIGPFTLPASVMSASARIAAANRRTSSTIRPTGVQTTSRSTPAASAGSVEPREMTPAATASSSRDWFRPNPMTSPATPRARAAFATDPPIKPTPTTPSVATRKRRASAAGVGAGIAGGRVRTPPAG